MIDRDELIESLTDEDIIGIMKKLGAVQKENHNNDNELLFTSICHHSNSYKLYFYKDSRLFLCFSLRKRVDGKPLRKVNLEVLKP